MKEEYRLDLQKFYIFYANSFILGFLIADVILFIMVIVAFLLWRYFGYSLRDSGIDTLSSIFCALTGFTAIGVVVKEYLKKGIIKCRARGVMLEDSHFIYKDKKNHEHMMYWPEVIRIKLTTVKLGYRVIVISPRLKFSFFSYEADPLPIDSKEILKLKKMPYDNFFRIMQIFRQKAINAKFDKDFIARRVKLPF